MKEFINIMLKDYQKEHFTKKDYIIYGIFAPVVLILILCIVNFFEKL